jgi:hypothetical protein
MLLLTPMPLDAAVARLESRTPVASALSSAEWAQMSLGLRERAFFSAGVENLRTVATMQNKIRDALSLAGAGRMNRANFVSDMRQFLAAAPGDSGELTDLTSRRRLELIYEHNLADAREYAGWRAGQDPDLLDEFPAQELVRHEDREEPRDWPSRWADAGGEFFGGRMIALKSDPVWEKISRFGKPWPPFDFGSGMGVEDIGRDEAEALGLIKPGERPQAIEADFNARLEASVPDAAPALLDNFKQIFGDQVSVSEGRIQWLPDAMSGFYDRALAQTGLREPLDLGVATPDAIAVARRDLGIDLDGWRMQVRAQDIRHALDRHGLPDLIRPGSGERDPGQAPLTRADFRAAPLVWRMPDNMVAADRAGYSDQPPAGFPGSIRIQSNIAGQLWIADYYADSGNKVLGLKTAWRKQP